MVNLPFRITISNISVGCRLTANNQLQKQMPVTPTDALFVCDLPIHKKRTTHRPMPSSTPARTVDGFPSCCLFETQIGISLIDIRRASFRTPVEPESFAKED